MTTRTRTSRSRFAVPIALLLTFALLAAACGDDDDDAAPATDESSSETDTGETDSSSEADTADADSSAEPDTGESDSSDTAPADVDEAEASPLTDEYSVQIAANKEVQTDTSEFVAEAPYTVATVVQGPINGWGTIFDTTMDEAMVESGKFDMDARLYVPWEGDTANQTNGIEDAIAQDVDAIMLTSLSRAGLAASVERATEAGIPVVLCMAGVATDDFAAELSVDLPRMGYDSAKEVAEQIGGSGKVVLIHGIAGVDAAEFWKLGATTAFAEYPDIEIVAEQNANWSTADALEVMRTILTQQSDIDAIWAGGFEMGVGIVDAYLEAGIDVPFIGGTGITNGFLRTAIENDIDFFAVQFPPGGSSECVNTLIDVLEGTEVTKFTDVVTVLADTEPITLENAEAQFRPQFNDDFIGPQLYDDAVYVDAGF